MAGVENGGLVTFTPEQQAQLKAMIADGTIKVRPLKEIDRAAFIYAQKRLDEVVRNIVAAQQGGFDIAALLVQLQRVLGRWVSPVVNKGRTELVTPEAWDSFMRSVDAAQAFAQRGVDAVDQNYPITGWAVYAIGAVAVGLGGYALWKWLR